MARGVGVVLGIMFRIISLERRHRRVGLGLGQAWQPERFRTPSEDCFCW